MQVTTNAKVKELEQSKLWIQTREFRINQLCDLLRNSSLLAQLVERSAFKHSFTQGQPKCQGFEPPMRSSFFTRVIANFEKTSRNKVTNYHEKLPSAPYSLVVFSSGFSQKKISWVYGIKMFAKIPKELKYYLQKTYIVHESFFIRTVYQVLSNAMCIKFLTNMKKYNNELTTPLEEDTAEGSSFSIIHVPDLTSLSRLIDITRLRISLNVYLHDYNLSEYIDVPDLYFTRLSDISKRKYRQLIFDKIYKKLSIQAPQTELVFQKPGSYKKVNIFLDIIERNNYIDISQWDIYSLASVFLNFLKNKANPLVPIDLITLPILDTVQYTADIFEKIIAFNKYYDLYITIFPLFISILDSFERSQHTSKSLSKAIAPSLCKEKISMTNKDRIAVGTRFIKNLLENFNPVIKIYEQYHRDKINRSRSNVSIQKNNNKIMTPQLPKPRKNHGNKNNVTDLKIDNYTSSSDVTSPLKSFSSLKLNDSSSVASSPVSTHEKTSSKLIFDKSVPNLEHSSAQQRISSIESITRVVSGTPYFSLRSNSSEITPSKPSTLKTKPSISSLRTTSSSLKSDDFTASETSVDSPTKGKESAENNFAQDIVADFSTYQPPELTKIQIFDKELKKQKQQKYKEISTKEKFSVESFTTIKSNKNESKVSKLAALYEERLLGLQVMNEIMRNK
ncbi:hypothetical protein RI543_000875 [Arxiozyma heterogenica]|uniref:Rho-GAP domain-containing protein n=1 Tax=Arxiozyma heterogenica TaxID=278026 RepID=A0AAN7WMK6_9SACH|nr:hypothetical protein RI543_000875 [Kazachstania heterogenica]